MSRHAERFHPDQSEKGTGAFRAADLSAALRIIGAERALHAASSDAEEVRERNEQIETIQRVATGTASAADRERAREILDALKARRARALS